MCGFVDGFLMPPGLLLLNSSCPVVPSAFSCVVQPTMWWDDARTSKTLLVLVALSFKKVSSSSLFLSFETKKEFETFYKRETNTTENKKGRDVPSGITSNPVGRRRIQTGTSSSFLGDIIMCAIKCQDDRSQ